MHVLRALEKHRAPSIISACVSSLPASRIRSRFGTLQQRTPKTGPSISALDPQAPKKRRFDEHTVSIWAQSMVQRGASPKDAIRMILNRIDLGRAKPTTALFNTAIDICGHEGLLVDAGQLLHRVPVASTSF